MTPKKAPYCSILILNYFGEKIIGNTLKSVVELNYPADRYEIIIVDNDSKDKSRQILESFAASHKNVRLIFLNKNLGFARGNNIGIKRAKGEYVALLNNDCVVEKNWLRELVNTAGGDSKIFAVSSKILIYPKYLDLNITIDPSISFIYSSLQKSNLYQFNTRRIYLNIIKKETQCYMQVPFDSVNDQSVELQFVFNIKDERGKNLDELINFPDRNASVIDSTRNKDEIVYSVRINLLNQITKNRTVSKIQNAGIIPFHDGYARDIGAIISDSNSFYEYDQGQYDQEIEIYAFCGAAVLLNKNILEKIGYLDESFFMYYEDVEISERARLNGYKIYYSPKAGVRHIHALSSSEGSAFFVYNVEKGRLLHVFYNFPHRVFLEQYLKVLIIIMYGVANTIMSTRNLKAISRDKKLGGASFARKGQLIKVLFFFTLNYLRLLYLKSLKKCTRSRSDNYNEILSGKWYFK